MLVYDIALVVHFLGLIGLFGGFILYHRVVPPLRGATTGKEARPWLGLLAATPPMHQGGLGFLLVSGLAMAYLRWQGVLPWMVVGLVGLVLIGSLTGGISGRWVKRVGREVDSASDGPLPNPLRALLSASTPRAATSAANGMALSLLWIMTGKPGWVGSFAVLAIAGAAGGWLGTLVARRQPEGVAPRTAEVVGAHRGRA